MTKKELYKVTDILNDVLSNYLRGSEAEEVIAKLEESVEDSELIKKEPVSKGFEEAIEQSFIYHENRGDDFRCDEQIETSYRYGFKAGANWQKEQILDSNTTLQRTFELGKQEMKQQLLAKAIDATVHIDAGGYPYIPQMELYDYDKDIPLAKEGDKYKVILIKED